MLAEIGQTTSLQRNLEDTIPESDPRYDISHPDYEFNIEDVIASIQSHLKWREKMDCYSIGDIGIQYKLDDKVCDDWKVWRCSNENCDSPDPENELSLGAWELLDGVPNPIEYQQEEIPVIPEYIEPSEADVYNLINQIPLESNLKQSAGPFILQMSLENFWNCFYDNSAPFFVNKYLEEKGNDLLSQNTWRDPASIDKYIINGWGYNTVSYRNFVAKVYVDNPFADYVFSHVNLLLLNYTDTNITTATVSESQGMSYSDRFRVISKFDISTPDPRSRQVVLRQSYTVHWIDKPWGVWKVIDPIARDKFEADARNLPGWFETKGMNYLEGLESGLYSLPADRPYWE